MSVLEPSAGTGNIAVLARLLGAQVDTNEIDPRRRELLTLQGFEPTAFDAERLDNLLPLEKTYHAIVMNPPFSATGGRINGHRTAFGARHIEQALLRLKPGGRLVAIVGRELLPGENPLLELMGLLLGDGFGEVQPPPALPISNQQWLDWHHLALMTPEQLIAAMNRVLETEQRPIPTEPMAMRLWAASLMLRTLDRLEMM
jgi:SAM-dependent methyltransferase